MGLYDEFKFKPASFLPHSNLSLEELERIRNIKREDISLKRLIKLADYRITLAAKKHVAFAVGLEDYDYVV